jgi:rhodanese-related sulfurtransferase
MTKKLNMTSAQMVADARARIEEIAVSDALKLQGREDVIFIDLRDVRERTRVGYIPGSVHCPRGMIEFWVDPESPYFKEIFGRDAKFLFYCASGWRSAITVATLKDMGFENAAHLKEGFSLWSREGGPVEMPDPLM